MLDYEDARIIAERFVDGSLKNSTLTSYSTRVAYPTKLFDNQQVSNDFEETGPEPTRPIPKPDSVSFVKEGETVDSEVLASFESSAISPKALGRA